MFIGGSLNQTSMMHQISKFYPDDDCYFSSFFADGYLKWLTEHKFLEFTVLGGQFKANTHRYFKEHNLKVDQEGMLHEYDLVFTCSDLIVPKKITKTRLILVQEGMTDPENLAYHLVRAFRLPRYIPSTSMTGLSHLYDKFCVASDGYRDLFIRKGVLPERIEVTGIPNFDNCAQYLNNDFPYKNFVLVATSDARETLRYENRIGFIKRAVKIANGKQLIFKLHPNENFERATREINKYAPGAIVLTSGNTNQMIANCDILLTKWSSVVYVGLALGKEVYSKFNLNDLKKQLPIQNGAKSAEHIAEVGKELLKRSVSEIKNKSGKPSGYFKIQFSHSVKKIQGIRFGN